MKLSAEETQVLAQTLGGIGGGALLGASSGALAGLAGAALLRYEIPQLEFLLIVRAAVGNGAIFGALTGATLLPSLLRGPLRGIPLRRWFALVLLATSLAALAGLLFGTFVSEHASEDFARVPAGLGIIVALIFGTIAMFVAAAVARRREDARLRREREGRERLTPLE
jgi:hypothetical protein